MTRSAVIKRLGIYSLLLSVSALLVVWSNPVHSKLLNLLLIAGLSGLYLSLLFLIGSNKRPRLTKLIVFAPTLLLLSLFWFKERPINS